MLLIADPNSPSGQTRKRAPKQEGEAQYFRRINMIYTCTEYEPPPHLLEAAVLEARRVRDMYAKKTSPQLGLQMHLQGRAADTIIKFKAAGVSSSGV